MHVHTTYFTTNRVKSLLHAVVVWLLATPTIIIGPAENLTATLSGPLQEGQIVIALPTPFINESAQTCDYELY